MICLGIESTAHTFGAGVVTRKGTILSDVRDVFTTIKGGMIPNEVAQHHKEVCDAVVRKALEEAHASKIDVVAYSRGPGLGPCLHVGVNKAKAIATTLGVPLIGVNHAVSHLTSGLLYTKAKKPVMLYLSGANTQVIALACGKYRVFGETEDIGLGNALDKFGRALGLGFPAGPKVEELAKKGTWVELPYSVKGMDVTFSGIVTKAVQLYEQGKASKEDLCYSLQETCFSMITEVTERAMAHLQNQEVLLIGGVAANKRLAAMVEIMCKERKGKSYVVPLKYAGDNGVQIAWQGLLEYGAGRREEKQDIAPYERTDDVEVFW